MKWEIVCVKKSTPKSFCHSILQMGVGKSKALANLVMALASNESSNSVTDLSRSACYHYQYSSISDSIRGFHHCSEEDVEQGKYAESRKDVEELLLSLKSNYLPEKFDNKFYLLNTDGTPIVRPHSPTLSDRGYVHVPNERVKGNRPVDVGHEYSVVGVNARRPLYGAVEPAWNLPLSTRRVPTDVNRGTFTGQQVMDLLNSEHLSLGKELVVNTLDRQYATPEYVTGTHESDNLINIIRLKNNRNVWCQLTAEQVKERRQGNEDQRGANAVYGEQYKLNKSEEWNLDADECVSFGTKLGNGRNAIVKMEGFNNMLIRSKRSHNMKDKPFRLISIQLIDPLTNEPIFKRKMWLAVWGKRRMELTLEQCFWSYRNRFDIEHYFRFGKQRLLMNDFQTPDIQHQDNWMEIVGLSYWLLWVASKTAKPCVRKWQKYDPRYENRVRNNLPPTPSEVQRQLASIILGFEQGPFIPKGQIKSEGRKKGQNQPKRKHYKVVYKSKKKTRKRA